MTLPNADRSQTFDFTSLTWRVGHVSAPQMLTFSCSAIYFPCTFVESFPPALHIHFGGANCARNMRVVSAQNQFVIKTTMARKSWKKRNAFISLFIVAIPST